MPSPKKDSAKPAAKAPAKIRRQPVVVVMGHIDHGKSTLLDYIRKANTVAGEAGGITQSIGAYEAIIPHPEGDRRITFIDTPGHEAFSGIRERGAMAADIAILMVSAEDGVKPQTLEALNSIRAAKLPFIVAINKIDRPGANIERTKQSLAENEVYVEGYGGDVPVSEISALKGTGVPDLLEMIYLMSDLEDLSTDSTARAQGRIIEADLDRKKGVAATVIVKSGHVEKGFYIATDAAFAPVRILENYLGAQEDSIGPGRPARIIGWSSLPEAGAAFSAFDSKKLAEAHVAAGLERKRVASLKPLVPSTKKATAPMATVAVPAQIGNGPRPPEIKAITIPLIIKADSAGSLDGIHRELGKLKIDYVNLRIVSEGIGEINEKDAKTALTNASSLIAGFNVGIDTQADGVIERSGLTAKTFKIIYELTDFIRSVALERKPKEYLDEKLGEAKILAIFGTGKDKQVVGGKVETGAIARGGEVKVMRRGGEIGRGRIRELQQNKAKADEVREGYEFGALISDIKVALAPGDRLEAFHTVEKK